MITCLDLTVHGGREQEVTRVRKQSDSTDTLENTQRGAAGISLTRIILVGHIWLYFNAVMQTGYILNTHVCAAHQSPYVYTHYWIGHFQVVVIFTLELY